MRHIYTRRKLILILICGLVAFFVQASGARAGTLTVNTNVDTTPNVCDGTLSLREAMLIGQGANALGRSLTLGEQAQVTGAVTFSGTVPPPIGCSSNFGPYRFITSGSGQGVIDDIRFANNVTTISVTSELPIITWAEDLINGLKSDGTKTEISGSSAGNVSGLTITATIGFTIRNLIIRNFQRHGILIEGSDAGVYEGLEIFSNGMDGISIIPFTDIFSTHNSRNNRIGGTSLSQRNFIHLNGRNGILIMASATADRGTDQGNVIENNYIGLKSNGTQDSGNGRQGIRLLDAFGNRIGGDTAASRNIISGNDENGIMLNGDGCYSNRIFNNFIGTNKDGNAVIGNTLGGIALSQGAGDPVGPTSSPNVIGDVGKGNVLAGNFFGIVLNDSNTSNNIIRGNYIGTEPINNLNLGNAHGGVAMGTNTHDNIIGGAGPGEGNVIAFNNDAGIADDNGFNNNIRGNRIFLNAGLGIDLGHDGVTPNDPSDTDTGSNNLQNFPVITSGSSAGGNTTVRGSINTTPNTALTLDFFVSPDRDPSTHGEGSTYLGSAVVTTDSSGNALFISPFPTVVSYQGFYATTTATDPSGNTSEFSLAYKIGCAYTLSLPTSQNFPVAGGTGSFNLTTTSACDWQAESGNNWITITGGGGGTGNGTISYAVAANTGAARIGTITVGGRTHTINQEGCSYTLSHYLAAYPSSGTSFDGTSVISEGSCQWTARSNTAWITITSGNSGSGNGSVIWNVAPNTGGARTSTLTIAGLTFTINQAGCSYTLSHFVASYPASGGGSAGVSVITESSCPWTAESHANWITITSAQGTGTGPVNWTVAPNPCGARQSTVTIAGQTFTVNQASVSTRRSPFDFDGEGKTDIGVFRPSQEVWYLSSSCTNGFVNALWGVRTDKLVPADYDGDGTTDFAIWRPSSGYWYIIQSRDGYKEMHWGQNGDVPVPADYDGDGKADIAVYRDGIGANEWSYFYTLPSASAPGTNTQMHWGQHGDIPVPANYVGDSRTDLAVFRPSDKNWYIENAAAPDGYEHIHFGEVTDKFVPGDYDGDGKADIAVYRPSNNYWYIIPSTAPTTYVFKTVGALNSIPAPGDYDGDGKWDEAVFTPSTGTWSILYSSNAPTGSVQFGSSEDIPIPSVFVR